MFPVVGIVVLILLVFGGFALTGGNLGPVMHALPHEMLIIGGACMGALIIGNSAKELKALGGGLGAAGGSVLGNKVGGSTGSTIGAGLGGAAGGALANEYAGGSERDRGHYNGKKHKKHKKHKHH